KDSDQNTKKRHDSDVPALKQPQAQTSSSRKTFDTREDPFSSPKQKISPQSEQPIDDVLIPDDVHISDSEDTGVAYLLKFKTRPDWLKPVSKEERPKTPELDWVVPHNDLPKTEKNWANAILNAYKDLKENKLIWKIGDIGSFIKWYYKQIGKSKLSKANLEGLAFKLVIYFHKNSISLQFQMEECHLLLIDQIDLVNPEGDKKRNALSISKLKVAYYPDFGLKELEPLLWIKSEHEYDISAAYDISHWWFKHKEFYITRHSAPSDRRALRSQMKILSVDATEVLFKEDHTIVHKTRAVIYRDRNNQKKMMRESEVHKFSDGTLTRILEKLDHMVKDYVLFKFNPSMEHIIWSEDDKRRIKEFIEVIERRLKIKRIFKSLESFVSGSSTMASAIICLATNQKFNFSKYIFDSMVKHLDSGTKFLMFPRFVQVFVDKQVDGVTKHNAIYVIPSHIKKVFSNMRKVGKDFSGRETPLFPTMLVPAQEEELSEDEALNEENVPAQSSDLPLLRVNTLGKNQGRYDDQEMFDTDVLNDEEVVVETVVTDATTTVVSIDDITLAQALVEIKTSKPKARGIIMQEPSETPTTTTIPISSKFQDRGKGIMVEEPLKMKKKDQISFDEQKAKRLQAEFDEQDKLAEKIRAKDYL
nr:hypothetical protein [Tanacetum cinerariifolium]